MIQLGNLCHCGFFSKFTANKKKETAKLTVHVQTSIKSHSLEATFQILQRSFMYVFQWAGALGCCVLFQLTAFARTAACFHSELGFSFDKQQNPTTSNIDFL